MVEWYEPGVPAQFRLPGGHGRGPNQSEVLQNDLQEDDINSEITVLWTGLQLQNAQYIRDSKKDEFLFIVESEPLSISDHVKNYIQAFTSMPIIWWPFSDPRRPPEQGRTRMTWRCASCPMHLSLDLTATVTEALGLQQGHKQMAAGASLLGDLHLDSTDLLLPGRDETFDDEERDESMSQCSTLVGSDALGSDALNEPPGTWQQILDKYCMAQYFEYPLYNIVSDRRGGRTAWSCVLSVAGNTFAARYWYDGQYVHNAKEDAAELALRSLNLHMQINRQPDYGQSITTPTSDKKDSEGSASNLRSSLTNSTSSPSIDSSSQSRRSQHTQRTYPSSSADTLVKTGMEVVDSPGKWVHWCVDATKTRLHEICVEAQIGAKRGREFINELIDSYRRLRGIRWWLSLTDCAAVKVVKFIRLLDEQDLVKCGLEKVSLDEIRRTLEYDISTGSIPDEDFHLAWVETTLAHYIVHHRKCITDNNIDDIISGLPKKTRCCMVKKARSVGYGIRGVHGLSVLKFFYILAVSTGIGLIFFVYWLVKHPGDIQNASVPYFMLMTAVGGFIAPPDLYIG